MKFRLTIDIDELNYAQAIRAIPLPEMVLSAAESPGVLENFLKFIPREKQDELILKTFDKNKVRIIAKAHRTAAKYGVDMKISDVSLEERTDDVIVY